MCAQNDCFSSGAVIDCMLDAVGVEFPLVLGWNDSIDRCDAGIKCHARRGNLWFSYMASVLSVGGYNGGCA